MMGGSFSQRYGDWLARSRCAETRTRPDIHMHNYRSVLWMIVWFAITLVSPGVYAQNEDTDLDATLNYIKDTILRYCGDNTFQYLDVQRSGQGVDVTLVVIVRIQGTTERRLFPLKEFDVDRIQFVHPGTENSGVYLHAVGHNPLTGGEGYEWAWVRCANVEIGASLAKAFQRAARICGARSTHDNGLFNGFQSMSVSRLAIWQGKQSVSLCLSEWSKPRRFAYL